MAFAHQVTGDSSSSLAANCSILQVTLLSVRVTGLPFPWEAREAAAHWELAWQAGRHRAPEGSGGATGLPHAQRHHSQDSAPCFIPPLLLGLNRADNSRNKNTPHPTPPHRNPASCLHSAGCCAKLDLNFRSTGRGTSGKRPPLSQPLLPLQPGGVSVLSQG